MMEWRVYGCGSASSDVYHQSSYECTDGETRLHIDLGNGAIFQRCRSEGGINAAIESIRHLLITHAHPDHTVDLTRHIVAWKYTPGYTPGAPVNLYGTAHTLDAVFRLFDATGFGYLFEEVYRPVEIEIGQSVTIGSLTVLPFPTQHMEGSIGVRVSSGGVSVAFTGDTSPFDELETHLKDLHLLIAEASFFETSHPMHLTLPQVAELAGKTHPKTVLVVHAYPEMEQSHSTKLDNEFRKHGPSELIRARDGMTLTWTPDEQTWSVGSLFPAS